MTALRTAALAIVMVALSWPALAQPQSCMPTPLALNWLAENGWEYHDAAVMPSGIAMTFYCRGEAALLIGHPPDGSASCLITSFPRGCMAIPEMPSPGTES